MICVQSARRGRSISFSPSGACLFLVEVFTHKLNKRKDGHQTQIRRVNLLDNATKSPTFPNKAFGQSTSLSVSVQRDMEGIRT